MKVIIYIIIAVVLFIGFSLWAQHYLNTTTEQMVAQIKKIEASVQSEDWKKANDELASLKNRWLATKDKWQTLLDHQEIDNIDIAMAKVNKLVDIKRSEEALPEISVLKMLIMHIPDREALRLENIL